MPYIVGVQKVVHYMPCGVYTLYKQSAKSCPPHGMELYRLYSRSAKSLSTNMGQKFIQQKSLMKNALGNMQNFIENLSKISADFNKKLLKNILNFNKKLAKIYYT